MEMRANGMRVKQNRGGSQKGFFFEAIKNGAIGKQKRGLKHKCVLN